MSRYHIVCVVWLMVCSLGMAHAELTLIRDRKAGGAVIVIANDASDKAREAATDFCQVIARMSGVSLPVVTEDNATGAGPFVLIGSSALAAKYGITVLQDKEDHDHYVIKTGKHFVAQIGNDDGPLTGTAYAVYDLLQRLGCGWYGVDEKWVVIPHTPTIRIPTMTIDERPAFYLREMGVNKGMAAGERPLAYAWRLNRNSTIFPCAHNLGVVVNKEQYPRAWVRGKANPCLTDPVSVQAAVAYARKRLDSETGIVGISLTAVDSDSFCDCPTCLQAGNISARLLLFANAVARELQKDYPGRLRLNFLAYWVTHAPPDPMVKAEPGVQVMIVNEGDHLKPLEYRETPEAAKRSRSNTRELRHLAGWQQTGALVGVYEWWIPSCNQPPWQSIPWYSGETALKNLRCWHRNGISYLDYETYGYEKQADPYPLRWPLHYAGARGLWNPNVTARQVMREACRKLYGPAAEPMMQFYRTVEQAAMDATVQGGNWGLGDPRKIYPPAVQIQASACLQQALRATNDSAILARIQDETAMWDQARKAMAEMPPAQ